MFKHLNRAINCASEVLYDLERRAGLDADSLQREREERRGLWDDEEDDNETGER